jgi:hypothetical protein
LLIGQDQPFLVKNPKSESNSALVKKRRAKTGAPPTIQVNRDERIFNIEDNKESMRFSR